MRRSWVRPPGGRHQEAHGGYHTGGHRPVNTLPPRDQLPQPLGGTLWAWGACLPHPHYAWAEPGAANMDAGIRAAGSELRALGQLRSWQPCGWAKTPSPLGGERPLLPPGSYSECSQGSLGTTKSSSGSIGQPHPPHLALSALRGPALTNRALGCQRLPRGAQEGHRSCRLSGLPSKEQVLGTRAQGTHAHAPPE